MWDNEADRFWTRNNVFLIVNTSLLIVVSSFVQERIICIFVSCFGFIFSIFWLRVNLMGKYYLDRWKPILEKLENGNEINVFGEELPKSKQKFKEPQKYKPSSTYMRYVALSFTLIWLLLLIYNTFQITQSLSFPNC